MEFLSLLRRPLREVTGVSPRWSNSSKLIILSFFSGKGMVFFNPVKMLLIFSGPFISGRLVSGLLGSGRFVSGGLENCWTNWLTPGLVFSIVEAAARVNWFIRSGFCLMISSMPGIADLNMVLDMCTMMPAEAI